jgi:AraC-like DNA-binding protein
MDQRIRIIMRVIEERNGTRQLGSNESGKLLGLSEAHFLRLFHRQVGTTFGRYLRQVRMNRAAGLLKNHTLSIKGIALDSGYNDISNFYRDFKKVHGINPRQVRVGLLILPLQEEKSGLVVLSSLLASVNPRYSLTVPDSRLRHLLTFKQLEESFEESEASSNA